MNRRRFLGQGALAVGSLATTSLVRRPVWAQGTAPAVVTSDRMRPAIPYGVQSGDVTSDRAIVWSRTDRPARLHVEWATRDSFRDATRVVGPAALAESDFTARVDLTGLPAGQQIFYRVLFEDLASPKVLSEPATGPVPDAGAEPPDGQLRVLGRRGGAGLGHQHRLGRHEDVRDDAAHEPRLLHPLRATRSTPTGRSRPR